MVESRADERHATGTSDSASTYGADEIRGE
jgi:hypothetical protein